MFALEVYYANRKVIHAEVSSKALETMNGMATREKEKALQQGRYWSLMHLLSMIGVDFCVWNTLGVLSHDEIQHLRGFQDIFEVFVNRRLKCIAELSINETFESRSSLQLSMSSL
jgi:hypothetical protein